MFVNPIVHRDGAKMYYFQILNPSFILLGAYKCGREKKEEVEKSANRVK